MPRFFHALSFASAACAQAGTWQLQWDQVSSQQLRAAQATVAYAEGSTRDSSLAERLVFCIRNESIGFLDWPVDARDPQAAGRVGASFSRSSGSPESPAGESVADGSHGTFFTPGCWQVFVAGGLNFPISDDDEGDPNVPSEFRTKVERFDYNDLVQDGPLYYEVGIDWILLNWVGMRVSYAHHPMSFVYDTEASLKAQGESTDARLLEAVRAVQWGAGFAACLSRWAIFGLECGLRMKDFRLNLPVGRPQPDGTGNELYLRMALGFGTTD